MAKTSAAAVAAATNDENPATTNAEGTAAAAAPATLPKATRPPAAVLDAPAVKQILADAKPVVALLSSQWKARESGVFFNTHEVVPNVGTPIEHLYKKEYWANVSQKFRPGDTIIAFPRDGGWYSELVVFDAGQNWANVGTKFELMRPEFEAVAGVEVDFDVRRDPINGYCVVRKSTGAILKSNFPNHAEGQKWIVDHQKALRT